MKNKIGLHYGSFVVNWADEQFPLIKKVSGLGFEVFEFGSDYLLSKDENGLKDLKQEAADNGIQLALSMGMSPRNDITSPDAGIRKTGIKELQTMAAAMAKAGITDCSGIVYCAWNGKVSGGVEQKARWKQSVESMKEAAGAFEDNGVYVNVEVVNRFENYLINDCDTALAYLEEVGSSNLGIHLDTFHMNIEEDSFIMPIVKAKEKLRYFHIGENNRKMPGLGMLPWKMIFDALKVADYQGPITMEPFVKPGGEVGDAVSLFREIMDTGDYEEDLRRSLAFVRALMA